MTHEELSEAWGRIRSIVTDALYEMNRIITQYHRSPMARKKIRRYARRITHIR